MSAATQLWQAPLKVKVPFAFSVNGRTMPAGEYSITEQGAHHLLVVRNFAEKKAIGVLIQAVPGKQTNANTRLEFRRYGSQYFLASLWLAGQTEGMEMQRTDAERRAAEALKNIAGVPAQPELVVVNVAATE